jgi:hypothetical protein
MSKRLSKEDFIQRVWDNNIAYRNGDFEIIGEYTSVNNKILVRDKYGELMVGGQALIKSTPNILSAIDKTKYFINRAIEIHGDTYLYDKVVYTKAVDKVKIYCKKHKEYFFQTPNGHLSGKGCEACSKDYIASCVRDSPRGWSFSSWIAAAKKSKVFDSFKVYIIKCWNEEEEFYKVGKTYNKIDYRFKGINKMPYLFSVIKVIEGDAYEICKLEKELQRKNKENKYLPSKIFCGRNECFSSII